MSSSRNAVINFAPYEPPPDARSSANAASSSSSSSSRFPRSPFASSSSASANNAGAGGASRPKSPWFSVGSYQSGARTSDLNSSTAISSSSSASTSYANGGSGGDVLWDAESGIGSSSGNTAYPAASLSSTNPHNEYETCYGLRIDLEAAAAYFLGPILAILLLIIETKNDYVRFHAWQSLLLGCGLAVLHLLFLWSRFFTWILVLLDLAVYGQLAYRAFLDSDTLQRYYLPRIGELAAQWVEEE